MSIKSNIKARGWSVTRIAEELGISQPSASSIINGNPTLDKLQAIARVMGCSVADLFADEDQEAHIICPHCGKVVKIEAKAEKSGEEQSGI